MPDGTNVIEADFRRNSRPRSTQDVAEQALGLAEEMLRSNRDAIELVDYLKSEWLHARRRARYLERALHAERSNSFSFTDDDVLQALGRRTHCDPVSAGVVAAELLGREPSQSARVRTGLALSRLASIGRVIQHRAEDDEYGRLTCRWEVARA